MVSMIFWITCVVFAGYLAIKTNGIMSSDLGPVALPGFCVFFSIIAIAGFLMDKSGLGSWLGIYPW